MASPDNNLEFIKTRSGLIREVVARHGGSQPKVFGSFARGSATDESDVDILLEMRSTSSLMDLAAIQDELAQLLGRKVDVLTEQSLHWYIRDAVMNEAISI